MASTRESTVEGEFAPVIEVRALREWLLFEIAAERETLSDYNPYHVGRIDAYVSVGQHVGVFTTDDPEVLGLLP
jgi:hypothetical protein